MIAYFTLYFIKDWISSSAFLSCMKDKQMNISNKCLQKKYKKSLTFYFASLLNSSAGNVPVVKACSLNKNVFHMPLFLDPSFPYMDISNPTYLNK